MTKITHFLSGFLGFLMFMPGIAKFFQPFKTSIYRQLQIIEIPFPEIMSYIVQFSEIVIGALLLFLTFSKNKLRSSLRKKMFYLGNGTVIIMMSVATYTHLHPQMPAEILPLESKPPVLAVVMIIAGIINLWLYSRIKEVKIT